MNAQDVWVAKDDGTDLVRASAIVGVGLDYNGNVMARLAGGDAALVTLVGHSGHLDERTPSDFHRQLIAVLAQLSDSAAAYLVRPVRDDSHGWRWVSEPL